MTVDNRPSTFGRYLEVETVLNVGQKAPFFLCTERYRRRFDFLVLFFGLFDNLFVVFQADPSLVLWRGGSIFGR